MAIIAATNIRRSTAGQWRTRDPINAADYKGIIEPAHTVYQRIGQTVPGLYGDWRTTSTTYTTATTTSDRDLATWVGASRMFRDLDNSGKTSVRVYAQATIKDCTARINIARRDSDGTETALGAITLTDTTTSLSTVTGSDILTEAQVSEGGVATNARAQIVYDIEFKHETIGTEAQMTQWHVGEYYDAVALLP